MPVSTALDTVDTIPPGTSTSTLGKASQSSFVSGQRSAHAENAVAPNPATTVVSRQPETATTSPTDRSRAAEATTAVDPPTSKTISTSLKPDLGGSPSRDPAQAGTSVAGEQRSPGRSSATMGPSDSCSCAQRPTRESAEDILRLNDPNMPSLLRVRWQQRVAGFNSTSVEHIVGKACTYFRLGHPEDEFVLTMDMDGDKLEVTDDILGRLRNGSVVTLKRLQKLDAVDDSRNDPATDSPQGNCVPQPRCDGRSA
ncbi:hypothetical protein L226DRAFT_343063 [Lentinus tigrinus ALCF2SS1-7]|uniref:uncharacterized protein n=1 Tax=Lentinus tigrinus ALCF2SS1-7 TaxID=1328758 RepID=UPI001165E02E|nr:hypothetical protein L226DRAFT_343063 [Lentinus tigrinus ALCF2SS1-7]